MMFALPEDLDTFHVVIQPLMWAQDALLNINLRIDEVQALVSDLRPQPFLGEHGFDFSTRDAFEVEKPSKLDELNVPDGSFYSVGDCLWQHSLRLGPGEKRFYFCDYVYNASMTIKFVTNHSNINVRMVSYGFIRQ
jgi:hypothetical protein